MSEGYSDVAKIRIYETVAYQAKNFLICVFFCGMLVFGLDPVLSIHRENTDLYVCSEKGSPKMIGMKMTLFTAAVLALGSFTFGCIQTDEVYVDANAAGPVTGVKNHLSLRLLKVLLLWQGTVRSMWPPASIMRIL